MIPQNATRLIVNIVIGLIVKFLLGLFCVIHAVHVYR